MQINTVKLCRFRFQFPADTSKLLAALLLAMVPVAACHRSEPSTAPQDPVSRTTPSAPTPEPAPTIKTAQPAPLSAATATNKTLYLTFDADMTPGMLKREQEHKVDRWYSPGLVEYLLENHIQATVFATGMFAEDYPELITHLAQSGQFSIQNHTYDHAAFSKPCYGLSTVTTDEQKNQEMRKASAAIEKLTGVAPTYLRHPGLCHKPHDVELAEQMGLKVSDDGTVSGDPFAHNPQLVAEAILRGAPRNPVIILHLGGPNAPSTEAAIKIAVTKLRAAGYSFAQMK